MKVGLIQYAPEWEDAERNFNKISELLNTAPEDVEMIILPEMTLTGFTMNAKENSEEIDGKYLNRFIEISRKHKWNILYGFIEKENNNYFNTLIHLNPDGLIAAKYRKIHLFAMAGENENYTSSRETVITKINGVKTGLSICYDLRFPELYRIYSKERVELIVDIANWPIKRINHWSSLLKARAIENQCYFIGVNRIGYDPFQQYNGQSACFDPMGKEIFNADDREGLFVFEIDPANARHVQEALPFLRDIKLI